MSAPTLTFSLFKMLTLFLSLYLFILFSLSRTRTKVCCLCFFLGHSFPALLLFLCIYMSATTLAFPFHFSLYVSIHSLSTWFSHSSDYTPWELSWNCIRQKTWIDKEILSCKYLLPSCMSSSYYLFYKSHYYSSKKKSHYLSKKKKSPTNYIHPIACYQKNKNKIHPIAMHVGFFLFFSFLGLK